MLRKSIRRLIWSATRYKNWPNSTIARLSNIISESYRDYSFNIRENGELWLLLRLASLGNISPIFDVGAHAGDWSQLALKYLPNAAIHCFEPSKATFAELSRNLANTRCILNNAGLADTNGTASFKEFTGPGCTTGSTFIYEFSQFDGHVPAHTSEALLLRGDDYCQSHNIDAIGLLKIDVEGYEPNVLRGFSQLLEKQRIACIQFEYGYHHADARFLMKDFYGLLSGYGYCIGRLWSRGVNFMDFDYCLNNFTSGPNFVAIPTSSLQLRRLLEHRLP